MNVLITTPQAGGYWREFSKEFPEVNFVGGETREAVLAAAAAAEVAFGPVDQALLEAAPQLRWIQSSSVGVEWMQEVPGLQTADIVVTNTRGSSAATIAEHAFGMLIFLARHFGARYESQQRRQWPRPIPKASIGLMGLTMGVVGLGHIGRAMAQRAVAFGMEVIAVDAHDVLVPDTVAHFALLDGLPDLIARANVVVVCTPITPQTRGMIHGDLLRAMPQGSFLLAISRGGIVDETTVVDMLHSGHLAGAGFDVTDIEPLPTDHPLWAAPNVFITPHCSPSSVNTTVSARAIMKENLRRYLAGEPLTNVVDKVLGY